METGKTAKYFKYAIGEIILVVIGILIALSINNWNEQRKISNKEKELLTEIYTYIKYDTIQLKKEYYDLQKVVSYGNFIKKKFQDNSPYEKKLDTAFVLISEGYVTEVNYSTYNRIENVGLEIIKNDSIRTLMTQYYERSKHLKYIEDYFENTKFFRQQIYPKYFKSYRHSTYAIPIDYESLKINSEFNIALDYGLNDAKFFMRFSKIKKMEAKALLKLIKKEIQIKN